MQKPDTTKDMNPVEFVQYAEAAGHTITGWVSLERTHKHVLYSSTPDRSPWLRLPEDWTINLLDPNPFPCPDSPFQLRWPARIRTPTPEPGSAEATLIELVVSLAALAQEANNFGSSRSVRSLPTGLTDRYYTVTFKNATSQEFIWNVRDGVRDQVIATRPLKPGDSFQNTLAVNGQGYANVTYWASLDGESLPTVTDQQVINMIAFIR
jgi:hypothetical protein